MSKQDIVKKLETLFKEQNYMWKVDGKLIVPTEEEISRVLDDLTKMLYDSDSWTQATVGRLIVQKVGNKHDVYAFVGTI